MIARILRIELLRSNARWLALLALLPAAPIVFDNEAGRGLTVLVLDQRQLLAGAFPLALGAAAWQARRDRRSRMDELLGTTPRARWQRVLPTAAALAIAAVAASLAVAAAQAALVVVTGGYVSPATLPIIAVGALALLVPVSFGLALGRWLPFFLIPPVAVGVVALNLFYGDTEAYTGGEVPGSMLLWGHFQVAGTAFDLTAVTARTHLGQALWFGGLVAAGLTVVAATRLRAGAAAVVALVVGASFAVVLLPARYADAFSVDPGATAPVCTPDAPRVCVLRAHQLALDHLRDPAREALATLGAKLPDAPTSVVEVPEQLAGARPRPAPDTLRIALIISGNGREFQPVSASAADIRWELLLGAGTPACDNAPAFGTADRRRYDTARLVAAAWLLDREPPPPADPQDPALLRQSETAPVYRELRALPAGEQRARVATLRAAELACTGGDRLDLLVGPGGRR
jgi:hypothetical protein